MIFKMNLLKFKYNTIKLFEIIILINNNFYELFYNIIKSNKNK